MGFERSEEPTDPFDVTVGLGIVRSPDPDDVDVMSSIAIRKCSVLF